MKCNNFKWIKVGTTCKWNDPAINDYDEDERENILNTTYKIISIKYEDNTQNIYHDTLIEIANDYSEAEVYAIELAELNKNEKILIEEINNINNLCSNIQDSIRKVRNIIGINQLNGEKTYFDNEEINQELINNWFKKIESIQNFCIF